MARTKNKNKKNKQPILQQFAQEFAAKSGDAKYLLNPKGEMSMSDAISKLIEPYREDAPDYNSFRTLVSLACAAWNASILPEAEREQMLKDLHKALPKAKKDRSEVLAFVGELIQRKERLFPHVSRTIVKFKVTDLGNDFHIAIASTLTKQESGE